MASSIILSTTGRSIPPAAKGSDRQPSVTIYSIDHGNNLPLPYPGVQHPPSHIGKSLSSKDLRATSGKNVKSTEPINTCGGSRNSRSCTDAVGARSGGKRLGNNRAQFGERGGERTARSLGLVTADVAVSAVVQPKAAGDHFGHRWQSVADTLADWRTGGGRGAEMAIAQCV
jgi:hypothetical protein